MAELSVQQKDIVMISSSAARGDLDSLEIALNKALEDKMSVNAIKEILIQLYAYTGFPRSLNAINTFIKVVDLKTDLYEGEKGAAPADGVNKNELGTKIQTELIGSPAEGRYIEFTPAIDSFLKEHLFADIFGRGILSYKEREIATIAALSSLNGVEAQLGAHIRIGKNTGLSEDGINEILKLTKISEENENIFGLGEKNDAYAKYFKGQSYLKMLTTEGVSTANVTFEPKCRNNWHIHHKGGQILLITSGRGYYQEWGKEARELRAGDYVYIAPEIKHWHGAAKDSWFSHVAIEVPAENSGTEWLEEVSDEEYDRLK